MADLREPGPFHFFREMRLPFDFASLPLRAINLNNAPRGDGQPVMVLPGYLADDTSTWVIRAYLDYLGYDVRGWGLGFNRGKVRKLAAALTDQLEEMMAQDGQSVRLVGQSLGGIIAREIARQRPYLVDRIITLGSPVVGGPKYTAFSNVYRMLTGDHVDNVEQVIKERNRIPIKTPITAIYSRSDGVVAWQACIDDHSPNVEHVEVSSSHGGMGVNGIVLEVIAERLAA